MSIEALQKRIKTTEDLRSIVSTMKALSSVSILQYEQANRHLKKYRDNLTDAFHALVLSQGLPDISKDTSAPRYLFILVGSDSGLVGKFNQELIGKTTDWLKSNNINIADVWFITIGKRITALAEQKRLKIFAKYASASVFAPLIFTIPFATMVNVPGQENQMMMNGANFTKNIMSGFVIFAVLILLFRGDWRRHVLPFALLIGYLVVLAFSNFAHSERFHFPAMPLEMMFAAFGVTQVTNRHKSWFMVWIVLMAIANIIWGWIKLKGRGLV